MKIPLTYTWRSLWTRRLTTALTLFGIALVVFVFAAVLMLAFGVERTLVDTGSDDNAIIVRRSASSELVSQIGREAANVIETQPEIAPARDGKPLLSREVYVVINLHKISSNDLSNVSLRGVSPRALELRPQVRLTGGRMFQFGTREIVLSDNLAGRFQGCAIGDQLHFGDDNWTIVGHFDAAGSGFDSEIWGDVDQFMPAFGRPVYSSVTVHLRSPSDFDAIKSRVEQDPRTQYVEVKREREYYREQSKIMADFIRVLGTIVTIIFSVGAVIGAMITMYASVANRTIEVGTLRSLGFRRRSILLAFLIESILLATFGGLLGIALASFMSFIRISTINFGTFSELAFGFTMSAAIVVNSLIFSVVMGIVGGFLPAVRAARLNIVNALRAS